MAAGANLAQAGVDVDIHDVLCARLEVRLGRLRRELGLHLQALNQGGMRLLQRLLDEAGHDHVALHLDVLPNVQAHLGRSQTQLDRHHGLPRQEAVEGPFVADVETGGRVAVSLQARGQIMEGACVSDVAVGEPAGEVGDPVGQ